MELSQRIALLVEYSELSVKALSEKLGFKTPQLLYELLKGKTKSLSAKVQDSILNAFPTLNKMWLLTGEGEMFVNESAESSVFDEANIRMVPLINLDARSGPEYPVEQEGEYVERLIPWENAHEGDFAITTSGTSMMPVIMPGSFLLLRKVEGWRKFLEYNILYVLELNDYRRLLKLVQKSEEPKCLTLISYNPNNPPQDISIDFINRIFKVVSIRTNYGF